MWIWPIVPLLLAINVNTTLGSVHSYLKHFEVLTPHSLSSRTKRDVSTGNVTHKSLNFRSLGKHFHLDLTPGWSVMADDIEIRLTNADFSEHLEVHVDRDAIFSGTVGGASGTHVDAYHLYGVWTAHIQDTDALYIMEPASQHGPWAQSKNMYFYRAQDLIANETDNAPYCGHQVNDPMHDYGNARNRRNGRKRNARFRKDAYSRCGEYSKSGYRYSRKHSKPHHKIYPEPIHYDDKYHGQNHYGNQYPASNDYEP